MRGWFSSAGIFHMSMGFGGFMYFAIMAYYGIKESRLSVWISTQRLKWQLWRSRR